MANLPLLLLLAATAGRELDQRAYLWSMSLVVALIHTVRHDASSRFGRSRAAKVAKLMPAVDVVLTDEATGVDRVSDAIHPLIKTLDLSKVRRFVYGASWTVFYPSYSCIN